MKALSKSKQFTDVAQNQRTLICKIEWTTNFVTKLNEDQKAKLSCLFLAPRSHKIWYKKCYYLCLIPYFSFAVEASFLGLFSLSKSYTIEGASPSFLLVFAKALWMPLTAKKNRVTLQCLEPYSQQIDSLNHVLCLVFVLETDYHSTKKHFRVCRKKFCWLRLSCSRQRFLSSSMIMHLCPAPSLKSIAF